MKKFFSLTVFLLALMLLLPLSVLKDNPVSVLVSADQNTEIKKPEAQESFKVLLSEQNKLVTLSREDYLFGVVAGEMPALYEEEALKAQTVCAYTFLKWRQKENKDKEYDITDNFKIDQCYISRESAIEKWGSKAEEYEQKLKRAIKEVEGQTLTYNGELILSVYHSLSGGTTESAKNVWGKDYPYLQAVSSIGDKLATNYITTVNASKAELEKALKIKIPKDLNKAFTDISKTESGYVKSLKIAEKDFSGSEIRELLGLKSTNFSISVKNDTAAFTVYGYGHGVGMSQNGANYMAKQGSDYKEILCHYYKDCEIK